jgi:hypothetical protein
MFVDAKRKFISGPDSLSIDHEYSIDSGMGGSYVVRYDGFRDGVHLFEKVYRKGAEPGPAFTFKVLPEELTTEIFTIIPENIVYQGYEKARRAELGIHPDHDLRCAACRAKGEIHIEIIGPIGDTATVIFHGDNHKEPIGLYTQCKYAPINSEPRKSLHPTCQGINSYLRRTIAWQQTDDQMRWVCPTEEVAVAYKTLIDVGFLAHGEEADWLKTGKWPA